MTDDLYNCDELRAYLLGAAPPEDGERFDELSVVDPRFVDQLAIAENDLVDAYAAGELTADEQESFETHYLASPLRRRKLSFAKALQIHAGQSGNESAKSADVGKGTGFRSWVRAAFGAHPWRLAASAAIILILLLFGVWAVLRNADRPGTGPDRASNRASNDNGASTLPTAVPPNDEMAVNTDQPRVDVPRPVPTPMPEGTPVRAPIVASIVLTAPLRGGSPKTFRVPDDAAMTAITLKLEADEINTFRVELGQGSGGKSLWSRGRINASGAAGSRILSLSIPGRLFKPGVYRLTVYGISAGGKSEPIGDYPFRVVR